MKIGDFFAEVTVKGGKKSADEVKAVDKEMKSLWSSGLAVKAMLATAFYGFGRMTANAGDMGASMQSFALSTGQSALALQQWQTALRKSNVSAEEVEATMRSIQSSVMESMATKQIPRWMQILMGTKGVGLDGSKMRDIPYVLGQIEKYTKTVAPDVGAMFMKEVVGSNVYAGLRANKMDVSKIRPDLSAGQIAGNSKAKAAWSELAHQMEVAFAKFNSEHGLKIVSELGKMIPKVVSLAESLVKLADSLKAFEIARDMIASLTDTAGGATDLVNFIRDPSNKKFQDKIKENAGKSLGFGSSEMEKRLLALQAQQKAGGGVLGDPMDDVLARVAEKQSVTVINNNDSGTTAKTVKERTTAAIDGVRGAQRTSSAIRRDK